jgi:Flp pilus assembly protein TadG
MNNFPTWYYSIVLPACAAFDLVCYAGGAIYLARKFLPKIRKLIADKSGSLAIEGAIIIPVFLLLTAISFELGLAQLGKQSLVWSTQQAATVQSTGGNPQTIFAANTAGTPAAGASLTCSTVGNLAQCVGTVTIANAFAGLIGSATTWSFTYTAQVQVPSQ